MQPPGPVRWGQGMFLLPQHFQQSDLHRASEQRYASAVGHPFPWGVRSLRIDIEALENDVFRVAACELVLSDGLVVRYPEAAEISEASFKDSFAATWESLHVYACVPTLDAISGGRRRFASRSEGRRDLFDSESESSIEFLVPKVEFIFTNDPEDRRLADVQSIQIAEIRRTGRATPRYELGRRYIAPLLWCDGSATLMAALRQVQDQTVGAARLLAEHRSVGGAAALSAASGDIEHLLALQGLNQFAAVLRHQLALGGGPPYAMFSTLVQLRGLLATFSPGCDPLDYAEYEHANLAKSFLPLADSIRNLLGELMPTGYREVSLQREGELFWAPLDEDLLKKGTAFVLVVRGSEATDEIRERVVEQSKVSSTDDIPQLISYADRGVPIQYLAHPPAEVPRHADFTYFLLDTSDRRWKRIRDDGDLAFYLANAAPDLDVRLFVVMPTERSR